MHVQTFAEYSTVIANMLTTLQLIRQCERYELESDQRSLQRGFLQGVVWFANDSELHWREFVHVENSPQRMMYAYHYQDADKTCIFRYDNAAHRPKLGFSDHKHLTDGSIVEVHIPPILENVITEIVHLL
jgi:hypothetical protein